MDLVSCKSKVIVLMEHNNKKGEFKVLKECTLPLTGKGVVTTVITDKAVFRNIDGELVLTEIAEGLTLDDLKKCTGYDFKVADKIISF